MGYYQKIFAFFISILIILSAILIFSINLANVSVGDDFSVINSDYVKKDIEIQTNFFGIPFIEARNESDLFFAVGYYHAKMRLWQMDYYRRLAGGRLSEVFGKETIKIDRFMRCFEIEDISKKNFNELSAKSRSILDSYSAGVNFFIEENSSHLSFEFNALNYKPQKWKPYHSLMVGKFLTFELSLSIWADITFGEIVEKLGSDRLKNFLPDESYSQCLITIPEINQGKTNKNQTFYSNEIFDIKDQLGIYGSSSGSNCWTITKGNDSTGVRPILANDAHLMISMPARWIQMKIESPEISAFGMTLPGIPLVLSGRNRNISWGVTNIMVDGFDYFVEELDSKSQNYLSTDSTFKPIHYIVDTIQIANSQPEIYYQRRTANSILISDFHILNDSKDFLKFDAGKSKNAFYQKHALSFRWVGTSLNDETYALYKINTASNFDDFKYALRYWSTPGLNFHYIDKSGKSGLVSSASIPNRSDSCNPNLPNPAWNKKYLWKGFIKLNDSIFSQYNPSEQFIASANNKIISTYNTFISNYWEPDSRIRRINELLRESENYTYRDAQFMQNDFLSINAKDVMDFSLKILNNYKNLFTEDEKLVLNKFRNWDFLFSRGSVNASVYTFFYEKLIFNIFHDDLGDRLYKQYSFISSIPTRKLYDLLKGEETDIFDIKGTKNIENRDFIIFKSFRDAVAEFNSYFGSLPLDQRGYGKMHKLYLKHPFSKSEFLKYAVDAGPFETGGNNTTINNAEWNLNNPYNQVIGASMRIINDLKNDDIYTSMPGGISGDPMHPNYSDQLQIWLNGGYVKLNFYKNKNEDELRTVLKIIPN